tara:strand:- start:523 stop:2547 length:2025 start_codon:yes stop_codon:yes gene_type:complete
MATLSGQQIANRYSSLIKTANDTTLSASLVAMEDGAGNDSDLFIATGKVKVGTTLGIGTDPSVAKLHINAGSGQALTIDNGNASFIVGKGTQYSFCIGDCNPVATVGGGTSSSAAQANSNYISSNTGAHSGAGSMVIMNGAGTGAIGIGNSSPASGQIEIGADTAIHNIKMNLKTGSQAFDIYGNSETLMSVNTTTKKIGIGRNVVSPNSTLEIGGSIGAAGVYSALSLHNQYYDAAATMNNTVSEIQFRNQFSASSSDNKAAAVIRAGMEGTPDYPHGTWTSHSSTQNGYIQFMTTGAGTTGGQVRLTSAGYLGVNTITPKHTLDVAGSARVTGTLIAGRITQETEVYKLEEYFNRLPVANASIGVSTNLDFELQGTGTPVSAWSTNNGGINIATTTSSGDEAVIMPHADTNQTAWKNVPFGTTDTIIWEAAITTDAVEATAKDHVRYHLGLFLGDNRLEDNHTATHISDQAFFYYDSSDTTLPHQTDNTRWHFCYSNNGDDYVTKLNIGFQHDTTYRFRIEIDSNRLPSVFINDVQYGLTVVSSSGATGRTDVQINNAAGYSTSGSPVAMAVDTVDATTKFVVGDIVCDASGNIIGTVTAVAATTLTLGTITHGVIDNEVLYVFGNEAASVTAKGAALKSSAHFKPQIGVVTRTTAARNVDVHYQAISRTLK